MHEGQVEVPVTAVQEAIANQFPELAGQHVRRVPSSGTVVAPYRVGDGLVARLPLVPEEDPATVDRLHREGAHARALAEVVSVSVPELIGVGEPFPGYPGTWAVWSWLRGRSLDHLLLGSETLDTDLLATDLAQLLLATRGLPAKSGWSHNGRGGRPLSDSEWIRSSIERSAHLLDTAAATHVWETALTAPPHQGPPSSIHGDPMPGNFLLRDGRLSGMIDVSGPVVGDPASDLQPAWVVLEEPQRSLFLNAMGADEVTRQRGRGWAFEMAISGMHYYEHSNPMFFRLARRTLDALLATV